MAENTTSVPPASGEQYQLTYGAAQVTVVEVGGGIRTYTVNGHDVLDGYPPEQMCSGARGQTLVPWPNRIEDGSYRFGDEELQLALTEPEKSNAIHGLVRWRPWRAVEHTDTRAVLECTLLPCQGYPFALRITNTHELGGTGLTVTTTATNIGSRPCPYAVGFHPYLTVGTDRIDDAVAHIPAATYLPTDDRGIPTDRRAVDGTAYDFRRPRRLGDTQIDYTYADVERDEQGQGRVTLATDDGQRSVALWFDESFPYVEIFTGDALPEPARRRTGLGVEPMTGPPNAFQTGTDVVVLAPGQGHTTTWGVEVSGWE